MDLTAVMRTAAATREFCSDPVPDEVLYRVLDNARFAPSGGNRQGWRVIVARDPAVRKRLRDLYLRSWRHNMQPLFAHLPDNGSRPADRYAEHMHELPVQLVVLVERAALITTVAAIDNNGFVPGASIYPFVQNIVLGLRAEGLGTTLTAGLTPVEAEARELLQIPDGFSIAAHLGVGWPARPFPTRLKRRPVEDFATLDRFGGEPLRPPTANTAPQPALSGLANT
jgi:nitroreductase